MTQPTDNHHAVHEIAAAAWSYMQRHHRGRTNSITQAGLAEALACNRRTLQLALVWMLEHDNRLIVSSCATPPGVYVPETKAEKTEYVEQLRSRLIGNARRLKHVRRAPLYPPPLKRQAWLFDEHLTEVPAGV